MEMAATSELEHRRIEMFMKPLSAAAGFEGRRLNDDERKSLDTALRYFVKQHQGTMPMRRSLYSHGYGCSRILRLGVRELILAASSRSTIGQPRYTRKLKIAAEMSKESERS